ncbi:MAG: caspase family protein [Planctomycetia bacterium]|nr:caspase family protein [Planctomycetia bacterium]
MKTILKVEPTQLCKRAERVFSTARREPRPPTKSTRPSRLPAVLAALALAAGWAAAALAQNPASMEEKGPKQWAILIGVEKYHRAPRLRYTINDVRVLARTLHERDGVAEDRILEMTDDEKNPRMQPLKTSIEAELPAWLAKPSKDDQLLVYFSGHGFRDASGKMYLAPADCDPQRAAATGIAVEWFREQIAKCKADFKLLVIDACHAGSEKGEDEDSGVAAKDLGEPFRDLTGVVTLAGSKGEEKSQIWEEKEQSLYSYWLNQALKGHADENGDGDVDVDELNDYVYRNVTRTAKALFPRPQTPVRIIRSGVEGKPVVVHLQPQSLKQVLHEMAEQLLWSMEERKLDRAAVLEFTNDTKLGELLGADFGALGRWCAEEFERQMTQASAHKFTLVDRRRLQQALSQQQFTISDLASSSAMKSLSDRVGGLPVVVLGTLRSRDGSLVTLQCKLMNGQTGDVVGSAGGTAHLSPSEWAMIGRSVAVKDEDRIPPLPGGEGGASRTPDEELIDRLDERSQGPHPRADPKFPFRVKVIVNGQERKGVMRGNDMFVTLRKGEVYSIRVENNSDQLALMRLLVDGLDTLPEKSTKGVITYEVAPRVNLEDARHWVLDPAQRKSWNIPGFVTETGVDGKYREFTVVDASESLAARQRFTDQIGMISAAFYAPSGQSRGVGTGAGREGRRDLTTRGGFQCGQLLGVVHLRYTDAPPSGQAAR